ncbi:MAG: SPOR domain-containing protein [Croceibacterium sp.]
MRLPVETSARHARRCALALILVPALASCGARGGSHEELASASTPVARASGPAGDFPVVVGDPYKIGATLFTPADTMNYDEVGYSAADVGTGVTGSHHTLPLPSYVEVTSLTSGKTILVRIERRGPMGGNALVALSPAAFAQLGATAGDPVRVRRVNPPEEERAALRAGRSAPMRMETPLGLIAVLKRKLSGEGSVALAPKAATPPTAIATVELPPSLAVQRRPVEQAAANAASPVGSGRHESAPPLPPLSPRRASAPTPSAVVVARLEQPPTTPATVGISRQPVRDGAGNFVVQAAAMSTRDRAQKVAGAIGGSVSQAGQYYRVRTGPFATREQAEASLAKVRAAGYSDARISTNG